jgi:RNA polymerase sigma-70 factor (ECF subfamily)
MYTSKHTPGREYTLCSAAVWLRCFFQKMIPPRNQNQTSVGLTDRSKKGGAALDQQAFVERIEKIKGKLYRTAWMYLNNEADALEAVDETVYRALKGLGKLQYPEFFETWVTRILLNECSRELHRRKRLSGEDVLPESAGPDAYDGLPLKEAVAKLPQELRSVVILRYFSGYTLEETAKLLKLPRGTVSTRQRRALKLLKLELGEEDDE